MKRYRRLRRLKPDAELIRRRAAGEPLRELAPDYDVWHTTLGRYFARPKVAEQLERAERLQRAERRAEEARWRAEQKAEEARRRAGQKAEREARRLAEQQKAAEERGAAGRPPPPAGGAQAAYAPETVRRGDGSARRRRESDPYLAWLDTPKNLSGRARAEASGLVRVVSPDGRSGQWVEAADLAALLAEGYQLDA